MTLDPRTDRAEPRLVRLRARVRAFLDECALDPERSRDRERDGLLAEVASFQRDHVQPFARLCAARGARFDAGPDAWPALPTDVFRHVRVSVFAPGGDACVFRTSGTTSGARGAHPFVSLELYDRAAMIGAEHTFLRPAGAPLPPCDLVMLALEPMAHVESSLTHMLVLFERWLGAQDATSRVTWALAADRVDVEALAGALGRASRDGRAVVLCATSFALIFAEDALGDARFALPAGSRVMFTGGFKGKTRTLDEPTLRSAISARYGVPDRAIVAEYGMTELSSQLWSRELLDEVPDTRSGMFWVPPWVRVTAVDPSTLAPLPDGERGLLRIDDLANVESCVSIQTADVGVVARRGSGPTVLQLEGRDPAATPRGCSLAIEEALSQR